MLILVPIVYSENDERRAFLYKVSARTRSSIEGIEINENSELVKYQELVINFYVVLSMKMTPIHT